MDVRTKEKYLRTKLLLRDFLKNRLSLAHFFPWLSILFFLVILFPTVFLNRLPLFTKWPTIYSLSGYIMSEKTLGSTTQQYPITGAIIEVGGYSARSDHYGRFDLTFLAQGNSDIPVIINTGTSARIIRLSYDSGNPEKDTIFVVEQVLSCVPSQS